MQSYVASHQSLVNQSRHSGLSLKIISLLKANYTNYARFFYNNSALFKDGVFYLPGLVNKFTIKIKPFILTSKLYQALYRPVSVRVIGRTRRRVHVMPWATPIRLIGKMRIGYLSPGEQSSVSTPRVGTVPRLSILSFNLITTIIILTSIINKAIGN